MKVFGLVKVIGKLESSIEGMDRHGVHNVVLPTEGD